jgi:hypothetical protein
MVSRKALTAFGPDGEGDIGSHKPAPRPAQERTRRNRPALFAGGNDPAKSTSITADAQGSRAIRAQAWYRGVPAAGEPEPREESGTQRRWGRPGAARQRSLTVNNGHQRIVRTAAPQLYWPSWAYRSVYGMQEVRGIWLPRQQPALRSDELVSDCRRCGAGRWRRD